MALGHQLLRLLLPLSLLSLGAAGQVIQQQQVPSADGPRGSTQTRTIEGTVVDKEDHIVPHASVLLQDTKTLQVRSYIADDQGRYHFYGLSTEVNYDLLAEANGMISKRKTVSVFDSHKVVVLKLKLTESKNKTKKSR